MSHNQPVAVLNTSIVTADGTFVLETINLEEAKALVADPAGILSAVGHESTAQILTEQVTSLVGSGGRSGRERGDGRRPGRPRRSG